jgi:hypothetical protein
LASIFIRTELDDLQLNLRGVDHLFLHLTLFVIELVHVIQLSEQRRSGQRLVVEVEFVDEFLNLVDDVFTQGCNDGVLNDVIVEGVLNHLLRSFVVNLLKEDFAGRVLPATEVLG